MDSCQSQKRLLYLLMQSMLPAFFAELFHFQLFLDLLLVSGRKIINALAHIASHFH